MAVEADPADIPRELTSEVAAVEVEEREKRHIVAG